MAQLAQSGVSVYPKLLSSPLLDQVTTFGTGKYTISGHVQNASNGFIARQVIAVGRDTGIIYDRTISRLNDGAYTLRVPNVPCIVYCLPIPADSKNAEIADNITPLISV